MSLKMLVSLLHTYKNLKKIEDHHLPSVGTFSVTSSVALVLLKEFSETE